MLEVKAVGRSRACSLSLYVLSASLTPLSCIVTSRNCADVSRFAFGRITSLSVLWTAAGTGTNSLLSPKLPKVGFSRQNEMRTSMLRNSYSTSSWSFFASLPSLVPFTFLTSFRLSDLSASEMRSFVAVCIRSWYACAVFVAFALMNWLHITSNLYFFVSRPTSTTKSWNSSIDISSASSADTSEIERQYARKMDEMSLKSGCRMSCTSFSHSGKPYMSIRAILFHTSSHALSSSGDWPGIGAASALAS